MQILGCGTRAHPAVNKSNQIGHVVIPKEAHDFAAAALQLPRRVKIRTILRIS